MQSFRLVKAQSFDSQNLTMDKDSTSDRHSMVLKDSSCAQGNKLGKLNGDHRTNYASEPQGYASGKQCNSDSSSASPNSNYFSNNSKGESIRTFNVFS
jgi:hypothetical protein